MPPQWSPSLADGTTAHRPPQCIVMTLPQWSPSLADGTTRNRYRLPVPVPEAAMEPVLGGRDDRPGLLSDSR